MPRFKRYDYGGMAARRFRDFDQARPHTVAVDTETSGFAWDDAAFCVTMTWRAGPGAGSYVSAYFDLAEDERGTRHEMVRQMLKLAQVWVFHNAKFDLQKLELAGILEPGWNGRQIEDTQILHALIDENDRHGLKYLANKILHESTNEEEVLKRVRRKLKIKKDDGYHLLPREVVVPYAMKDTEFTLRLYEVLKPFMPAKGMEELYAHELRVSLALGDIEGNGIGLDVGYLKRTTSEYGIRLMQLEARLQELASPPNDAKFNPNSVPQIIEAFDRRGYTLSATNKFALAEVPDELATTLLDYRRVKKLHGTYLTGMLAEQRDGIIHPNFNLTLPRTGRMSSSGATNN